MKKILKIAIPLIIVLALFVRFALPAILHKAGLHAAYADAKDYDLKGKKALIITTSHDVLNAINLPFHSGGFGGYDKKII